MERDSIAEAKLFFTNKLPLHYWKRMDPESVMDEEQLAEKRDLDKLAAHALTRSQTT